MPQLIASHKHLEDSDLDPSPPFKNLPPCAQNHHVNIMNISHELRNHPDQSAVTQLLNGLKYGFDIGFRGNFSDTFPKNNSSALKNSEQVSISINKEIQRGHTAGPFIEPPFKHNHISPIGAAIKNDGSARLIMDLSQPSGLSVNDYISKEEFPTNYVHFDVATTLVRKMGRGCFLSKVDIKHAFRLLPVMSKIVGGGRKMSETMSENVGIVGKCRSRVWGGDLINKKSIDIPIYKIRPFDHCIAKMKMTKKCSHD